MTELKNNINSFFKTTILVLKEKGFTQVDEIIKEQHQLIESITKASKKQLKRIKNQESGTKNSTLYLNVLTETKNLLLFTINLIKAQRDFLIFNTGEVGRSKKSEKTSKILND
jgi:Na+/phosphate symporter